MALKSVFRAELKVAGQRVGNLYWDGFSGGKYTQQEVKYVGYDWTQKVYVGRKETENITLEANFEPIHRAILKQIGAPPTPGAPAFAAPAGEPNQDIRGLEAEVVVLDYVEGNYIQNRAPLKGRVLDVVPPDGDSNDATTLEKIQVVVSVRSENGPPQGPQYG